MPSGPAPPQLTDLEREKIQHREFRRKRIGIRPETGKKTP
jgi:hypothetical protein